MNVMEKKMKDQQENGPQDLSRQKIKVKVVAPVFAANFQFTAMKKRLHPISKDFSTSMRKTALLKVLS